MSRRQIVNILIAVNGIGFVLCGTAIGGLVKTDIFPWYSIVGIVFMFLGIVIPVYREFLALTDGFDAVDKEAMSVIRHRRGEKPYQQVIENPKSGSPFLEVRHQYKLTVIMTLIGWALVIAEGIRWLAII